MDRQNAPVASARLRASMRSSDRQHKVRSTTTHRTTIVTTTTSTSTTWTGDFDNDKDNENENEHNWGNYPVDFARPADSSHFNGPVMHEPRHAQYHQVGDVFEPAHNPSLRKAFSHPPLVLSPKLSTASSFSDRLSIKAEALDDDEEADDHDKHDDVGHGADHARAFTSCRECDDHGIIEQNVARQMTDRSSSLLPGDVSPRAAVRNQIFSLFLDETLVKSSVSRATSKRGMSYVAELLTLDLPYPVLNTAIEAHCLAWLGASKRNKNALHEAEFAYGRVLNLLGRAVDPEAIARTRRSPNLDRAIITSIMLAGLHMCARANWHTHYLGVQQYLLVRGPAALDLSTHFDRLLFGELRLSLLLIGLASRKSLVFDRYDWRKNIEAHNLDSTAWYSMVMPVPTLLDRVDRLLLGPADNPSIPQRLTVMCARLEALRDSITHWLHATSPYAGTAPQIIDVADDDGYDLEVEEHCFIATSTAFDTYYRFPIVPLVFFPMNAWLINLIIECTILRVLHSPFFDPDGVWPIHREIEDVHQDASTLARNICRCVHAFSRLPSMVDASFLSVCLELVRTFYEESEQFPQSGWCQACAIATSVRISRMKAASEQGALKVDYLKEGIGGAARWKPRAAWYNPG